MCPLAVLMCVVTGAQAATFEELASQAAAARRANRIPEAIGLYRQAVEQRGTWIEGWWFLGTLSYAEYHYPDCEKAFGEFVKLDDQRPLAWSILGLCEFETGNYEPATEHLKLGLAAAKDLPPEVVPGIRFHYGLLLSRAGQFEQGKQQLERYAQGGAHEPMLIAALGLNALHQSLMPKDVPPDKSEAVMQAGEADRLWILGQNEQAGAALRQLADKYPALPGVHYLYGSFLSSISPAAAMSEFRRELAAHPDHPDANAMLAFLMERADDLPGALPYARKAATGTPPDALSDYVYGDVLLKSGDLARAIVRLEEAERLDPALLLCHTALATAYSEAGRRDDARRERLESLEMAQAGQNPDAESSAGGGESVMVR